ncbi:ribonuclease HII [Aphanothece hegewaldii CCALA 016]|uniref:Ribonuclease HII n=1 Tax=Aphanothece hegewaldii CCALA 016 TaxID=2107694 RepID=A0A2T1LSU6_9CHRO|nr:ribonuclease HII [Aphanothece hegewaldii]PSF33106.1 ribonuclease HII [Aphanothece hegewaldii CCALA 016]
MKTLTKLDFIDFSILLPEITDQNTLIAGVDEVGRGCLFGPVVAAAVVLPVCDIPKLIEIGVKDSKLLTLKRRTELNKIIKQTVLETRIGYAKVQEIDQINILQASLLAMQRSITKLKQQPTICLVDGRQKIPDLSMPQYNIIKGDQRSPVIAAASIVAKVWRDDLILRWSKKYQEEYDLAANKGYGTQKHLQALAKNGVTSQHRLSFRPCQISSI